MATQSDVLEKVGKLIRLSQSDNEEEARTAAMTATRLMSEHKLVCVPLAEIERVQKLIEGAQTLAKTAAAEGQQKMMLGAAIGFMLSKKF